MARVSSGLLIVPIPAIKDTSSTARVVLIVSITICLFPVWPVLNLGDLGGGTFLMAIIGETSAGLLLGLALSFIAETFQVASQIITLQSGFSFASTIDPMSQADTNVFQSLTQLATGLLFFVTGVHLQLIKLFGRSFDLFSPANAHLSDLTIQAMLGLGAKMFANGLKMGLPVITLLVLIDLGLAILNRLQAQLQLMLMSFPIKTALSFVFLSALMLRWPSLYQQTANQILETVFQLVSRY